MRVLFKAVQDTSVKKVIDNIKGEVNSLGGTMDAVNKKMGGNILGIGGGSDTFKKLNPHLFQNVGKQAAKDFAAGFKGLGMADLPKIFSKTGPALPAMPAWMTKSFLSGAGNAKFEAMNLLAKQGGTGGVQSEINKAAEFAMQDVKINAQIEKEAKKAERERLKQAEREAKNNATAKSKAEKSQAKSQLDTLKFYKDMSLLSLPLLKPTSVFGTAFAARAVSQGLLGTEKGRGLMGSVGLSGARGAAIATAALVGGATALGLSFKALRMTITDLVIPAIKNAAQLYAKSLTTGLNTKFLASRGMAAKILGVSEEEVIRFGKALDWLNPKIREDAAILAAAATPLATTNAYFEILKIKIESLGTQIAMALKPTLDSAIRSVSAFVEVLRKSTIIESVLEPAFWVLTKIGQSIGIIVSGVELVFKSLGDLISILMAKIWNAYQMILHPFDKSKRDNIDTDAMMKDFDKDVTGMAQGISTQWAELLGKGQNKKDLPNPQSYMKQLGASALEHMGLIMGGGGSNPAKETSKHTKQMVTILNQIHRSMSHGATSTFDPAQSYR